METVVGTSTATSSLFPKTPFKPSFNGPLPPAKRVWCRPLQNCYSPFPIPRPLSLVYSIGSGSSRNYSPLTAKAKKSNTSGDKKGSEKKKKVDSHSFAPRPDEATGPFPESILLREKKLQEDGELMPEFADEEEQELFEFLNLQLESDLQVDQMRHYEVVYLIHQDYDEQVEKVNSKIQDFLKEKQGKLWRFSDWGMRRLAYKIKKATHAHYILMNFELETKWINDFKRMLDQDERVIRHLVIKRDKAITEDCPPPPEFHTLRGEADDYEEDEDDMDDEEYDDDEEEDEEDWEDEDENEIESQDNYDDVGGVEEENILEDGEDDDDGDDEEPARVETGRKKGLKVEKAVK